MNSFDQAVLTSLRGWAVELTHSTNNDVSAVYVFGSLVNSEGRAFSHELSDIDLIIAIGDISPDERQSLFIAIKREVHGLEVMLSSLMNRDPSEEITSCTIVNRFELEQGIHKDRNSRIFFAASSFLRIDVLEDCLSQIGNALAPDLLGENFTAWTSLANAQSFRNKYLRCSANGHRGQSDFDSQTMKLPKDLMRSAYAAECFRRGTDTAFANVDDTARGLRFIEKILEGREDSSEIAREFLSVLESNRPGGKGRRLPVRSNFLLYAWDIVGEALKSTLLERRLERVMKHQRFAATETKDELIRHNATHLLCVDGAVQLYRGDGIQTDKNLSVLVSHRYSRDLYELSDVSADDVARLASEWPLPINRFLLSRHGKEGSTASNCKVGFHKLDYSETAIDTAANNTAKLHIRPISYWVTRNFNKELAKRNQNETETLKREYFERLVCSAEDFMCQCPSQLFVETAIVTSDRQIPIFSKRTPFSVAGVRSGGEVLTCGPEYGFEWSKHVRESSTGATLDIEGAIKDSLSIEFGIDSNAVKGWRIQNLAIQTIHLNTSLLGIVMLNVSQAELQRQFAGQKYHSELLEFISVEQAFDRIQSDFGKKIWHPTGLMRLSQVAEFVDAIPSV